MFFLRRKKFSFLEVQPLHNSSPFCFARVCRWPEGVLLLAESLSSWTHCREKQEDLWMIFFFECIIKGQPYIRFHLMFYLHKVINSSGSARKLVCQNARHISAIGAIWPLPRKFPGDVTTHLSLYVDATRMCFLFDFVRLCICGVGLSSCSVILYVFPPALTAITAFVRLLTSAFSPIRAEQWSDTLASHVRHCYLHGIICFAFVYSLTTINGDFF